MRFNQKNSAGVRKALGHRETGAKAKADTKPARKVRK